MRADLHVHTYYSDGMLSPSDVAAIAKRGGVELVSVTDHDTCLAYPEVFSCCEKEGVKAVYGIEISAYLNGIRLHTLGYGISPEHPAFREYLKNLAENSLLRAEDILFKLKKAGIRLNVDEVLRQRHCDGAPLHAMHIARAGAERGYAFSPFDFQRKYLSRGTAGYSDLKRPTPEEAVEIITDCGGFSSLAHPGRIELEREELRALVSRLKAIGLQGIEAVYSTHTQLEKAYYREMAAEYGLLVTGGSDTHFKDGGKAIGTPVFDCGEELCKKLKV